MKYLEKSEEVEQTEEETKEPASPDPKQFKRQNSRLSSQLAPSEDVKSSEHTSDSNVFSSKKTVRKE